MHKKIKNTKNIKSYILGDNYFIYYYESKNAKNKNKAVYYIEFEEVVILDKNYTKEDLREFIDFLESEKLPINDFRYI
jgi:hypothetical protein